MGLLDDIGLLRLVVAIVDRGSLSGAGRQLGLALPVVSRRLSQLEGALGMRLFNRTTRRLAPTADGEWLYRRACRLLGDLDQAEQSLLDRRATVSGRLRLTAPMSLGRRRIAPLLAAFGARHPGLTIQLELTDAVLDLVAAGIDLAVRYGAMVDSSFISRPLAPNYRVLCASPAYLAAHGVPLVPADLVDHACLVIGQQGRVDWRIGDQSIRIESALAANDGEVVHLWALDGHGIALKSIWDVHEDLAAGRLVRVLADQTVPAAPLHAVYPHRRQVAPRVRACVDFLVANIGASAPHALSAGMPRRSGSRVPSSRSTR